MKNIDINILQLAQGAVQEKLDREFEKVFENIQDPNVTATSKLAPTDPVTTTILTGKDLTTNKIEARKLQSGVPGQTYIDEKGDLRTDTGEPVDVIEKETRKKSKVIDLQEKRG